MQFLSTTIYHLRTLLQSLSLFENLYTGKLSYQNDQTYKQTYSELFMRTCGYSRLLTPQPACGFSLPSLFQVI